MRFVVKIETDNDALAADPLRESELGRIIADIQYGVRGGSGGGVCHDYNGNRVGTWHLTWEESSARV